MTRYKAVKTPSKLKQRSKMIVAMFCVLSFVLIFLISAPLLMTLAEHGREANTGCALTLNPECFCESSTPLQQTGHEAEHACLACALVQKAIDPLRELGVALSSMMHTDLSLLAITIILLLPFASGCLTPIRLKTRIDN